MRIGAILLLVGTVSVAPLSAAEDAADRVLRHGVFYSVSAAGTVEGSLAIRAGRIVYLGNDAGAVKLVGPKTEIVELGGRAVTPGLIDAHSHLAGYAEDLAHVDLRGVSTFAEAVERVRGAAAKLPAGEWVRGRGWDQNRWPDKQLPTHEALSRAVPDHPVYLERVDGHAALLNARAMALMGITSASADPSGGRYVRAAGGAPTGVVVDRAKTAVDERLPLPSPAQYLPLLRQAAKNCVAVGLTTVTDMGIEQAQLAVYDAAAASGGLDLRVSLFLSDQEPLLGEWFARGVRLDPAARMQIRGVKLYADGALGSRGAALVEPYRDDPGNIGLLVTPGDHMAEVARHPLLSREEEHDLAVKFTKTHDPELAYRLVTELIDTKRLSDQSFAEAVATFGEHGVVELGTIIGYYTAIGNALNVFQVGLPPGQAPYFPEK